MSEKIIQLVALKKPYTLPSGQIFETKRELEAYIMGLKDAKSSMNIGLDMSINNSSLPLNPNYETLNDQ